jgi:hypothetical protein
LLALVWLSGGQFYYPYGLLVVVYALGCVPVADIAARGPMLKATVIAGIVINSVVAAVISLPLIPLNLVGATPIPQINALTGDQVGWSTYVAQIEQVVASEPKGTDLAILTSNYGEAGALSRFGQPGLPPVYSGHNELFRLGPPAETVDRVVVVGAMLPRVAPFFGSCTVKDRLDNRVSVKNEEQGRPIAVCDGRNQPWSVIWPALRHLD